MLAQKFETLLRPRCSLDNNVIKHVACGVDGNVLLVIDCGEVAKTFHDAAVGEFTALFGGLENGGGDARAAGGGLHGGSGYLDLSLWTVAEAKIGFEMLVHENGILNQTQTKTGSTINTYQKIRALLGQRSLLLRQLLQLPLGLAHTFLTRRQLLFTLLQLRPLGTLLAIQRRQFLLGTFELFECT